MFSIAPFNLEFSYFNFSNLVMVLFFHSFFLAFFFFCKLSIDFNLILQSRLIYFLDFILIFVVVFPFNYFLEFIFIFNLSIQLKNIHIYLFLNLILIFLIFNFLKKFCNCFFFNFTLYQLIF